MKGLRKYLAPFAPDQSGASAVLYALGGILVICDAGGCAGNICGFDEPRWFIHKSAIFSAGLRDMDAILGRDERLVTKLQDAAGRIDAGFAAIIGTPVPAVIATDYAALRRMAEKRVGLPILTVDSNGMELYDVGASKAYLALMRRFAQDGVQVETTVTGAVVETVAANGHEAAAAPVEAGRVGVLGMTPLDYASPQAEVRLRERLSAQGAGKVCIYGYGSLQEIREAGRAERNIVVAPSGLAAARYLKERFGTPYECADPLAEDVVREWDSDKVSVAGKRILVIHQQVRANAVRALLEAQGAAQVTTATWFMKAPGLSRPGDLHLTEEDALQELLRAGSYDMLVADREFWSLARGLDIECVELNHHAVSGRVEEPWS